MSLAIRPTARDSLSWWGWLAIALAFGPFAAKRALLLGQHDYIVWLAADYGARVISLAGVIMARQAGLLEPGRPPAGLLKSILVLLALIAANFYVPMFIYPLLRVHLEIFVLWNPPFIPNPFLRTFDLTLGLLLVAVSEEYVFRGLLMALLERLRLKAPMVIVTSAAAFALIHWTSGLADTLNAFLAGLLLGVGYRQTRRLSVCIFSHYLVDLYGFSGWVPSWLTHS
jgi:membrane protease YdiL (CAAX protease family)